MCHRTSLFVAPLWELNWVENEDNREIPALLLHFLWEMLLVLRLYKPPLYHYHYRCYWCLCVAWVLLMGFRLCTMRQVSFGVKMFVVLDLPLLMSHYWHSILIVCCCCRRLRHPCWWSLLTYVWTFAHDDLMVSCYFLPYSYVPEVCVQSGMRNNN